MKKIIAACALAMLSTLAFADPQEDEINSFVQRLSLENSREGRVEAIEMLQWKGISDPRVYDPVEKRLLDEASLKGRKADDINHDIRVLGYSGQRKYASTIQKLMAQREYERHSQISLTDLALYEKWNPIISNRANFDPKYSDDDNRVLNMLHADDYKLKMIGAKRIYFGDKDDILLETLAAEVRADYPKANSENYDEIAWMVKALGRSKQEKYKPLLKEVVDKAPHPKVVAHAQKALKDGFGESYLPGQGS